MSPLYFFFSYSSSCIKSIVSDPVWRHHPFTGFKWGSVSTFNLPTFLPTRRSRKTSHVPVEIWFNNYFFTYQKYNNFFLLSRNCKINISLDKCKMYLAQTSILFWSWIIRTREIYHYLSVKNDDICQYAFFARFKDLGNQTAFHGRG